MGLGIHEINFLRFAFTRGPFGRVATMGRQGLGPAPERLRQMGLKADAREEYGEGFLKRNFGATSVESFDYSDFEGATHVVDLNIPISGFDGCYDTIIDCGTMEHVFNAPQGLRNVANFCATGGQIIHVVPANNQCNHGFWQFSPELFFSLYCAKNGFAETEVFLADVGERDFWYRITPPRDGHWDYIASSRALYVLVRTVKRESMATFREVQQAQYVNDWHDTPRNGNAHPGIFQKLKAAAKSSPISRPLTSAYRKFFFNPDAALHHNRQMQRLSVSSLTAPNRPSPLDRSL